METARALVFTYEIGAFMIVSERIDKNKLDFERLLNDSHIAIEHAAQSNPKYFVQRSAIDFESDVFDSLCEAAKGTDFDKTIYLISGHKFPDIIVKKFYGVEVKTTKQNYWKSIGNSVLESTRVDNVERIYIFFAKLTDPIGFKYRLYQDCLYDIAVTHSPRYLIDMELDTGSSIFDKIGMSYDELRSQNNPIKAIVDYYRSISQRGEEPWWMDSGESPEVMLKPTVTLWSNLSGEEQAVLRNEAMARFPEIFSRSGTKYQNLASWLAARHGIVDSSLRDRFSAGGRVNLEIDNRMYSKLPRVFLHLKNNASEIIEAVKRISPEEAKYYWDLPAEPLNDQKIYQWTKKLISYSSQLLYDSEKFIIHLLGVSLSSKDCPLEVRELLAHYGLKK